MRRFHRAGAVRMVLLWLLLALLASPCTVLLGDVAPAGQETRPPAGSESARVAALLDPTGADQPLPLAVIWTPDAPGERITASRLEAAGQVADRLSGPGPAAVPVLARDGMAVTAVIPAGPADLPARLAAVREAASAVPGTTVHLAGPAAARADLDGAFAETDGALLGVALGGVLLILLLVYRSVLLPLLVIGGALMALAVACAVLYALARPGLLAIDGQTQGIVFVLVIGASTDYALLLTARHREELAGHVAPVWAMTRAYRATRAPVLASAATIACAMLTLGSSTLPSDRSLGPAVAIAMASSAAVSLSFLPAALMLCGPQALRPRRTAEGAGDRWVRAGLAMERRPRRFWLGCLVVLAAGAACAPLLTQSGVPLHRALPAAAPSVAGQNLLARHFPAGTASPAVVVVPRAGAARARSTVAATPGVAATTAVAPAGPDRVRILATLTDAPDSAQARATVSRLRASLAGTGALVGGESGQLADLHRAAVRDHRLITALVLGVVLAVLIVLLRCLLLPLLLVAAAWLSLLTAFGASALVFRLLLGSAATEPAVVLFSFVFLVALGVDYNIFLVHRVRAEAMELGTAAGVRRGLVTTGGVISAAGIILAATFAALAVMPLLYLAQIGCIVAIGVLIDTLLVRLFLVPALILDLGHRAWWPARLPADRPAGRRVPAPAPAADDTESGVPSALTP
ncbi:MMPL family transporter [Streptomyces sp. NPDC047014]|uniref:MMPL family transporter n=1 Tax=Streptomyces sp. NPDC047014 TaxID=3155736 RepID=UPI0034043150